MPAATARSSEAPSLPPLPSPGRNEKESRSWRKLKPLLKLPPSPIKSKGLTWPVPHPITVQSFAWVQDSPQITWRACPPTAPPLLCTSYTERVGVGWKGKGQRAPSSPALAVPLPLCHHSPPFSLQQNPHRPSTTLVLKSPGIHRLT